MLRLLLLIGVLRWPELSARWPDLPPTWPPLPQDSAASTPEPDSSAVEAAPQPDGPAQTSGSGGSHEWIKVPCPSCPGGFRWERAQQIDQDAVDRYGYRLCLGSCGMVCASHGGGLRWSKLAPGEQPYQGKASTSPMPPERYGGCPRCGQVGGSGRFRLFRPRR